MARDWLCSSFWFSREDVDPWRSGLGIVSGWFDGVIGAPFNLMLVEKGLSLVC